MTDFDEALAEITAIRSQMARSAGFRGYGPVTLALTGVLAVAAAFLQARLLRDPVREISEYLIIWGTTAALSIILIGIETVRRSRRVHSGLADAMVGTAVEQFMPAAVAGALLTLLLLRTAPENLWMLPGLWQVVFSLGVFASCHFLPRPIFGVGVWYLMTGLACLVYARGAWTLSPWAMGIPYGVGQIAVSAILWRYRSVSDERE
jgi:hypothetical protein